MGASVDNILRDIAKELQAIRKELHTIASSTKFNSKELYAETLMEAQQHTKDVGKSAFTI